MSDGIHFSGRIPSSWPARATAVRRSRAAGVRTERDAPFVDVLRGLMAEFSAPIVPGLPRFTGGAVGYFDYDAAEWFEPAVRLAKPPADRDQATFMVFDTILAFDHVKHRILAIANARVQPGADRRTLYDFAVAKIEFLERELERGLSRPRRDEAPPLTVEANQTREAFEAGVRRIQEDIAAGEIYQAVLSQRFETTTNASPFDVYRALRHINPSPTCSLSASGARPLSAPRPRCSCGSRGRISRHIRLRARAAVGRALTRTRGWPTS